jgi:hypothetical protein
MQTVSENFLAAVKGSSEPVFQAFLYKDGNLVAELDVEDGSVTYDSTQNVQASAELIIADRNGTIVPSDLGAPFTPFAATINIQAGFKIDGKIETVSLGWFIIWNMEIEESFSTYDKDGEYASIRNGSLIKLTLRDLTQKIEDYKFLTQTSPKKSFSLAEIEGLVGTVLPFSQPGFATIQIDKKVTYPDSRFDAIKALASLHQAEPFLNPNGELTLRLLNPPKSESNTAPALDWGINVTDYQRSLTRDNTYNIVVARGKDKKGKSLVEYATIEDGPLNWKGAFGPRPVFYDNELITTATELKTWAKDKLDSLLRQSSQTIPLSALPNPAIQLGDYVTVTVEGAIYAVTGRVVGFQYPARGEMSVSVSLSLGTDISVLVPGAEGQPDTVITQPAPDVFVTTYSKRKY